MMLRALALSPLVALLLQAQVHVPQMGSIRCQDGTVRPVYGVPASFILGKPKLTSASASSFSDGGGIVAARHAVQLLNRAGQPVGEFPITDPEALVNIDTDLASAIAWLPQTHSLLYWEDSSLRQIELPVPLSGRVTSLRREGPRALLLVFENGSLAETAVSLSSGNILSVRFVPGVEAPAFREGDFFLFPSAAGLEIEGPEGRRSLAIDASNLSIERMASGWLHLSAASSSQHWALHIANGTLQLFELPAVPPAQVTR